MTIPAVSVDTLVTSSSRTTRNPPTSFWDESSRNWLRHLGAAGLSTNLKALSGQLHSAIPPSSDSLTGKHFSEG